MKANRVFLAVFSLQPINLDKDSKMGKYKQHPRYNVVSIRVSDDEKALLDEITRRDHSSMTDLMRKAISSYTAFSAVSVNQSNTASL